MVLGQVGQRFTCAKRTWGFQPLKCFTCSRRATIDVQTVSLHDMLHIKQPNLQHHASLVPAGRMKGGRSYIIKEVSCGGHAPLGWGGTFMES